jgi:hypothetical protein
MWSTVHQLDRAKRVGTLNHFYRLVLMYAIAFALCDLPRERSRSRDGRGQLRQRRSAADARARPGEVRYPSGGLRCAWSPAVTRRLTSTVIITMKEQVNDLLLASTGHHRQS